MYFLDEVSHDKFVEIMLKAIKNMVLLKENKEFSICKICLVKI